MTTLSTWVDIDLDALASNLRLIRSLVGAHVRIHLVVKADAYGHGAYPVARVAEEEGVHSVGVATLDEGIELRRDGIRIPIVILSPSLAFEADRIVEHALTPSLGDLAVARALSERSCATGKITEYHVEIDTGMGRSGIAPENAVEFLRALASLRGIRLVGMFTHFPKGDSEAGRAEVERQVARLRETAQACRYAGIDPGILHAANSAGIVNHHVSHLDMVRPGILAYGVANGDLSAPSGLRPVMRFATRLVHVREMPAGHAISYGGDYVTPQTMRVGTAAVGYGHGYPWSLSGRGQALLRGQPIPILGRVTMDTTVFDLRPVPEAALGDEIVLFGSQGEATIRVDQLASLAGTIPYELLIGIGRRVPRIFIRDGRRVGARTLLGTEMEAPLP
ncbi:MAG TPA: alanine racemase [bacterium]|nr:alanine racemase [bacterium]